MKNLNDVLKQKEAEVERLQREIEALRTAARLLSEDEGETDHLTLRKAAGSEPAAPLRNTQGPRQFP